MTSQPRTMPEEPVYELRLVPVEIFGADHYGIADAVPAWSDCNRARGRIFRVDDIDPQHRRPQDVITIYVPATDIEKLTVQRWGEDFDDRDD